MSALELWTNLTMPRNKIVIGIPAYGTAWVPAVKSNVRVGEAAQWSRSEHYYNICNPVKDLTEIIFDTQYCAYYKVLEDRWISYDPPESYLDKVRKKWLNNTLNIRRRQGLQWHFRNNFLSGR